MSVTARSAKAIVLDAAGRALLLRRSDTHPKLALEADLPGGVILPHETHEEGMVRELTEETGLELAQIGSTHLLYKGVFYDPGKNTEAERLLVGIRLRETAPTIRLSSEHDKFDWVETEALEGIEEPYQMGIRYVRLFDLWHTIT